MPNRLAHAMSPYLLQHRENPVDWYEWGPEAFRDARSRDVPLLLSIGYAACHWCHVMAHESFEDPVVAEMMNESFVNIKVDREERPDVDALYMTATQAIAGRGGWPMTVFLTHDGRPFHAGTYYPPRPRPPIPCFSQLLEAVSQAWRERRGEIEDMATTVALVLSRSMAADAPGPDAAPPGPAVLETAVRRLARSEDREFGGFGDAPKFPPSLVCTFLLRHAARARLAGSTPEGSGEISLSDRSDHAPPDPGAPALDIATRTLRAMARSGVYDQVAGGFARYAVDRAWTVPHFEKMLYDNALLARTYLDWWRLTGDPTGARVAQETCTWMVTELRTPQGALASSMDADTALHGDDGPPRDVEGATYVWTPDQLVDVLGPVDGPWACGLLGVTPEGTFEHGTSTLRLTRDVWADPGQGARWRELRRRLAEARALRPQPGRDDKVVAAWNGLALAALAETGALLGRPELVEASRDVAEVLIGVHTTREPDGRRHLRRVSRDGRAGAPPGVLEDYGDVAEGLLALYGVTGEPRWLEVAGELLHTVLDEFRDLGGTREDGRAAFRDTSRAAEDPTLAGFGPRRDLADSPAPSGTTAAAGALLTYAALTGSGRHREAAESALRSVAALAAQAPQGFGWALAVAEALADGPREVAVVGPEGPGRAHLHRVALLGTAPGRAVAVGAPETPGVPLLADRRVAGDTPTAFVCREFTCDAPTTDPLVLARALGSRIEAVAVTSDAVTSDAVTSDTERPRG